MNILITGGAGYIGSKVALDLINKGKKVIIIDNLSTGNKSLVPQKAVFFNADISNKKIISFIFDKYKIDSVYHFAAYISVPESLKKPKTYFTNNYLKSKIFIDNCIKYDVKYFVYSSTAAIYQNPKNNIKIRENFKKNPKNPYGLSKLLVEKYIENLKTNMKFCILRYFNVAGADRKLRTGQINDGSNLFKNLSKAILKRNKIFEIYGKDYLTKDGTAVRDFIHLEDLSNIHLKSLTYLKNRAKRKTLTLNCGYGVGHSVHDVVSIVKKRYKLNFVYRNKRNGDLPFIVANCNKLKKKLLWRPKFNSIQKMIDSSVMWERKL
jgi:UDP-glucose 4-epimerase